MKKNVEKNIIKLLMIIFFIAIIYSVSNIIYRHISLKTNKDIKEIIDKSINVENIENDEYTIDFEYLKKTNSDIVAYLKVENTNVEYVVTRGSNNNYYLYHNINKEKNVAGWIFMDYNNKLDSSDKNIVIYGHNMGDGSMFGELADIYTKNKYKELDKIYLITEEEKMTYQVFSIYSIIPEDYYINTIFNNNSEYQEFLSTIKSRSVYDYNIELDNVDNILTLSTCNLTGDKRIVIHAKKINSID